MRNLGFFAVAALLILVQSNLFRLIGPIGTVIGARWVHGATPSLARPWRSPLATLRIYWAELRWGSSPSST
jgi:hypothetical protein